MTALATTSTLLPEPSEPLPLVAVQKLFDRLISQLGKKFHDLMGDATPETVQQEWAMGLAGFRRRELQRGIEALRGRRFAPVLGEFALLCRPAMDPEYAWYEAQDGLRARDRGEMGVWSHPAVWRAAIAMGEVGVNVRNGTFLHARKRWEMNLNRQLAAGWGDEVPEPVLRLVSEPTLKDMPSDVRKQLSDLSKQLSNVGIHEHRSHQKYR